MPTMEAAIYSPIQSGPSIFTSHITNYSKRYDELEKLVDDLKHINWLDHDTRALIMQQTMFDINQVFFVQIERVLLSLCIFNFAKVIEISFEGIFAY